MAAARGIARRKGFVAARVQLGTAPVWSLLAACGGLSLATSVALAGVTDADILKDAKTRGDVVSYGMGPHQHRFSFLDKINTTNVAKLVPAWALSFGDYAAA